MIEEVEIKEKLANSDHNIVFFKMRYKSECKNSCVGATYDYNKADFYEMRNFLNQINWDQKFSSQDVNQMWCIFCNILNEIIQKCVPVIKKRKYKYPQWMTKEAKKLRNFKSKLWPRYRKSREYNDLVEYKRVANRATSEYKKAKLSFEKKLAQNIKSDPKSFYAYARSKSKVRDTVGPLKDSSGAIVDNSEEMCGLLNDFFTSVYTKEDISGVLPKVEKIRLFKRDYC